LHQIQSNLSTLDPRYTLGLIINSFAFTFLLIYLVRRRYEVARLRRSTELAAQAAALEGQ
jgi:phage terminase large subunit-like protein